MKNNIYIYIGEEDYLIELKTRELKGQLENPDLNSEVIDGQRTSPEIVAGALQSTPMFGSEKLVIINELEITADNQEAYLGIIKQLGLGINVVFTFASIDKRLKFFKNLVELGEVSEFKRYAPWELAELSQWISAQVKDRGKTIMPGAVQLLQEFCGNQLRLLVSEIDKLVTYLGERSIIEENDVRGLSSSTATNAFALADALRAKDLSKSLKLFQLLLKNKEDPFQLISLLFTQYRLMLQLKALSQTEKDPWQMAKLTGNSPYFVKKCSENIRQFTLPELQKNCEALLSASLQLKTGQAQPITMELLMTSLCGK